MPESLKTVSFSMLALIAFAGNSVLCRLALSDASIDPASFTVVRLLSGVVALFLLLFLFSRNQTPVTRSVQDVPADRGDWVAACMLFVYAALFSYAYISIDTATGALVLFGTVQITLIVIHLLRGNGLTMAECLGTTLAVIGFVYLVWPELSEPSLPGFILMAGAGIAWAIYTIKGQGSIEPLTATAFNFLRTLPFVLLLCLLCATQMNMTLQGLYWAVASGALTSGVGYAIWYAALRGLSTTQAGVIQLSVPVLAALGGIMFASEAITSRFTMASLLVLGGIFIVIIGRRKPAQINAS